MDYLTSTPKPFNDFIPIIESNFDKRINVSNATVVAPMTSKEGALPYDSDAPTKTRSRLRHWAILLADFRD